MKVGDLVKSKSPNTEALGVIFKMETTMAYVQWNTVLSYLPSYCPVWYLEAVNESR